MSTSGGFSMDQISLRCSTCDHQLKVGAERAGRKVKCPRCNALLTIPEAEKNSEEVTAAAPAPKPADDDEEGGGGGGYGFLIDPKEEAEKRRREEEERKRKKAKKDEPKAVIKKRVKTIYDVDEWKKVRVGLIIVLSALACWGLQFLLHEIVVLVGIIRGPEYGILVNRVLEAPLDPDEARDWPKVGQRNPIDRMGFVMSLVSGYPFRTVGKVFFILGEVFLIVMFGMFFAAYTFFAKAPNRFGNKGLVKAMMWLCGINLFFGLFFKLLPMATNFGPALIPLVAPEVAMGAANIERMQPLQAFWMHSPFWETLLSLIVQLCFWVEPMLIGVFLWNCGKIIKEEYLEESGASLSQMAAGVYFIHFAYLMLSLTGTSDVVLNVLKVVYVVAAGFFIGYVIWFAVALNNSRIILDKLIEDTEEEEKRTGKKKRAGKLRRDDEEEDEYEDEDDYEDEEEDDYDRDRDYDDDDDRDDDYDDEDDDDDRGRRRR